MKSCITKTTAWIKLHRKTSAAIAIILLAVCYYSYKAYGTTSAETTYVVSAVARGNVISTVSGSGAVEADDEINLTSKVSGDLVAVNVKAGDEVKAGAVIAQVDAKTAYYDLQTAQLSYDKLIANNSTSQTDAENSYANAAKTLGDAYINGVGTLTAASTNMSDVLTNLDSLFNCNSGYMGGCSAGNETAKNYIKQAQLSWYKANDMMVSFSDKFRSITTSSSNEDIEDAIGNAYDTSIAIASAAKDTEDAIVYVKANTDGKDLEKVDTGYSLVLPIVSSANSVVSSITSLKNSLTNDKQSLANAKTSLDDFKIGGNAIDIRSSALSLSQKQEDLADYTTRAPFDGVVASVAAKAGDTVNSGTAIATLITKKKIVTISLNEIDIAKVKIGQKVMLTFDAFDTLTMSGVVSEVDSLGTVSQGVVSYKVKITLDTDNDEIKPGMTANANIITDMVSDVLTVPLSAVKSAGDASYVEVVDNATPIDPKGTGVVLGALPTQAEVVTGAVNDESIEIVSGLKEGDKYISRTITPSTATKTTTSAPSLLSGVTGGGGNARGGFGGGARAIGR